MSKQSVFDLAKEIRKDGEKWQSAVKRASAQIKKAAKKAPKAPKPAKSNNLSRESILKTMQTEKAFITKQDFKVRPNGNEFELVGVFNSTRYAGNYKSKAEALKHLSVLNQ